MKQLILTLILPLLALGASAQPKFAAKARKAIVSVHTFDRQGATLHQGPAFFVGANGEAVASYSLFKGASRAVVEDAAGKQTPVDYILGADDSYSLVRFHADVRGNAYLTPVAAAQPAGTQLFMLSATAHHSAAVADTLLIGGKYAYYSLDNKWDESLIGSPVFNAAGQLAGIYHTRMGDKDYVLDIRFRDTLRISAFPSASAAVALGNIAIPKALPATAEEALVYIFMQSRTAADDEYLDLVNRFVATWPRNAEGYLRRATPLIDQHRFEEADADLGTYLDLVADKAAGHYAVALVISDKLRLQPEPAYEPWTLDAAIGHVDQALSPFPASPADSLTADHERALTLKAQLLTRKADYDQAIDLYGQLARHGSAPSAYLYALSMARLERDDSLDLVLEPLDSAIAKLGTPIPRSAAQYVIRRGQILANFGQYRQAVLDYNQYAYLMNNQMNHNFYYERSQIEVNGRMYQQAIDDINKAIELQPNAPLYYVEKAAIVLRVSLFDECIEACDKAISLNPNFADAYRIKGFALLQKDDDENARINIQKAIDLGDETAKSVMEQLL